jgi:hypothetical protein
MLSTRGVNGRAARRWGGSSCLDGEVGMDVAGPVPDLLPVVAELFAPCGILPRP